MPTPSPSKNPSSRPDPSRASREELLRYFAVDPEIGLTGREADRRRDRTTAKPLFGTTAKPFPQCLLAVLREPVLWILVAVSLIALFFHRVALGMVCFVLTCAHVFLCAFLLYRAGRVDATMQRAYDAPLARVRRSKRPVRIGADAVVPGDILLIYPGDLIPADCRLLRTEHFSVSERELDAANPNRPAHTLDKDADFLPEEPPKGRVSPPHMVYAGAIAESGFALALVVAVGDRTHLGGLLGEIRPAHGTRGSDVCKSVARVSTLCSIVLAILIIPLVAIGIFTLRDRFELLDLFLCAVSLAVLGLCEHTVARYAYLTGAIRRDAATARDADNTADIRDDTDAEKLTTMTDLLLLGSAALHDGLSHPETLFVTGRHAVTEYRCDRPDADAEAAFAVEMLFLWHYGRATLPSAVGFDSQGMFRHVDEMLPFLCDWSGIDAEGLLVKYKDIQPLCGGVSAVVYTPEGNRRLTVALSDTCPDTADGSLRCLFEEARESGFSALLLSVSDESDMAQKGTVRAILTYAPRVSAKTAGWIKSFENAGIRVVSLLSDVSVANTRTLAACGLTDRHSAVGPASDSRRIAAIIQEGVRAFEGCTDREIGDCIRDLRADGHVVGVLSVDARDAAHLHAADVAITCSPSLYAYAENDFLRPIDDVSRAADGAPNSDRADDLCRRRANVVVRRARVTGGGLGGVRTALLASDRMATVVSAAARYLFLANALRLVCVLLAGIFGLLPIPAPLLLLSGFAVDTAVLLSLRHIPPASAPLRRRSMSAGLDTPWLTGKTELICLSATAALPWLVALIARLAGAGIDGGLAAYAMLSMVALQTAVYTTLRPRRDGSGKRRTDRTYAVTLLLLVLIYIATLAAALGTGLHPLYAILVPPIPALLYILITLLLAKWSGRSKK